MTATVETVVEQLDLTPVMPAIARAITLTESDVGNYFFDQILLLINEFNFKNSYQLIKLFS